MAKEDTETRHEVEETPELEPQTYWNHVKTIILILVNPPSLHFVFSF